MDKYLSIYVQYEISCIRMPKANRKKDVSRKVVKITRIKAEQKIKCAMVE